MAIPNFSQTTLTYDAGRGAETGQSNVTITTLPAPGKQEKQLNEEEGEYNVNVIFFSLGDNSPSNLGSGTTLSTHHHPRPDHADHAGAARPL